jgi:excisionase family DNA binding protein
MNLETEVVTLEPFAVRLSTAARLLECGVTTVHKLIHAGQLEVIHVGADRRVTLSSIKALGKK